MKKPPLRQLPINARVLRKILKRIDELGPDRLNDRGDKVSEIHFVNNLMGVSYKAFAKWDVNEWIIWVTNEYMT